MVARKVENSTRTLFPLYISYCCLSFLFVVTRKQHQSTPLPLKNSTRTLFPLYISYCCLSFLFVVTRKQHQSTPLKNSTRTLFPLYISYCCLSFLFVIAKKQHQSTPVPLTVAVDFRCIFSALENPVSLNVFCGIGAVCFTCEFCDVNVLDCFTALVSLCNPNRLNC